MQLNIEDQNMAAIQQKPLLKSNSKKKRLCFVIGPIGKDGDDTRKHADLLLHSVIRHVLATTPFEYHVKRADEDADPGMIGDRVISDIVNADLVVADLTNLNPNAFYELGIRHASEKPTIHMARVGTALPFDNISHRTIFVDLADWGSTERARAGLRSSAEAIDSPGFKVSNPITQANASFKMRESADPRDLLLAEFREDIRRIDRELRLLRINTVDLDHPRGALASLRSTNRVGSAVESLQGALEGMQITDAAELDRVISEFPGLNLFDRLQISDKSEFLLVEILQNDGTRHGFMVKKYAAGAEKRASRLTED